MIDEHDVVDACDAHMADTVVLFEQEPIAAEALRGRDR
jgi:hypothetical protein